MGAFMASVRMLLSVSHLVNSDGSACNRISSSVHSALMGPGSALLGAPWSLISDWLSLAHVALQGLCL